MDAVDTLYANTRNNPIEDIETHLPLRVERYELREDAGGAGQWRGGLGSVREFRLLSDGGASVEGEGHRFKPWGLFGGRDGATARLTLRRAETGESVALPSKVPHMETRAGDIFICEGPAGGGYGDPFKRPAVSVRADFLDGLISRATAELEYGVTLTAGGEVDVQATNQLRQDRG